MCGRYILDTKPENIYQKYNITPISNFKLDQMLNIFPSSLVPVITNQKEKILEFMKWGMVINFSKSSYSLINTRAESLIEKPYFIKIYLNQRCLIPATGFFEWKKEVKNKTPYKFWLKNTTLFSFAGVYNLVTDSQNNLIKTFSIVTTKPNNLVEQIHNRMPVILDEKKEKIWLNKESVYNQLNQVLEPFSSREMKSAIVNI